MQRIAVVGAGLAGLAAARELVRNGIDTTVLEARERAGGRVWSGTVRAEGHDHVVERGAEFVLDGYTALRRLLAETGLELVDTGMSYYVRELGDLPAFGTGDVVAAGREAVRLAGGHPGAPSAGDVLTRLALDPRLVEAVRARVEISTAVGADEVTARALEQVASFVPGPSWRVAGGNQRLPDALAADLGNAVHYNTPVVRVSDLDGGGAVVATADGGQEFDAVLVALPLALVHGEHAITLPGDARRDAALAGTVQGHAAKLHVPLRERPSTSAVMSVRGRYWTWTARDTTGSAPPVLNGFMGSRRAIEDAGLHHDPGAWAADVRRLRPDLDIAADADVLTTVWSRDPYARGAYSAHAPTSGGPSARALEEPIGSVHWAGEYTEPEFTGLMEGAIRSGERAAARILRSLHG
ncbi:NAD(P)/FAD-dependent oxidoreductase [Streptomyces sp. NPDC093252]|uniref:flavin monoamine oxidase family protein n=1 Tax=Streptomyces sp. NPDC093252 TaxID=3154980 RepID=UPI003443F8E7